MVVLFTPAFLPSVMFHLYCALICTIVYILSLLGPFHNSGILTFHHHGTVHNIFGDDCYHICSVLAFFNGRGFARSVWLIKFYVLYKFSWSHFLCFFLISYTKSLTVSYDSTCIRPHLLHLFHFTCRITPPEEQQTKLWWHPMLKCGLCSHRHTKCYPKIPEIWTSRGNGF
jgi:hypothetical protein